MLKKILILLVFSILHLSGYSQLTGYKYEVSKKVFDAIVSAYGSNRGAPAFEIRQKNYPGKKQILMYYPGTQPKIIMDEDVYDLCAGLGADSLNALASLLGHELAHYYEKHNWCSSFAFLLDDKSELKQKLSKIAKEEKSANEAEADDIGGFYGYVAGFSTYDVSAKLLDKIYAYYKLPNSIKGYPSKDERKQIAATSLKKLEQYEAVFDAGETMYCLKEYSISSACFEYLADKFPSREMFGNTGLVKVLSAMDFIDEKTIPFALPLEIDAETRLKSGVVRGSTISAEEKEIQKNKLLKDAINYFDKAIAIEPLYCNALINKGCAYILLNNSDMAIGIANEIITNKTNYNNYDLSKAYTLRGAAQYFKGDKVKAQEDFELAQKISPISRNTYNLAVIKELNKGVFDVLADFVSSYFDEVKTSEYGKEKAINPALEKIGSESASQPNSEKAIEVDMPLEKGFQISFIPHDSYKSVKIKKGEKTYSIIITEEKYNGKTSQGIGKGENAEKIKLKYGEPTYTVDELKGKYLVYRKSRIVFLLNQSNQVIKWFTYY